MQAAISPKTGAIVMAHTLGNPFNLDAVMQIAKDNDLFVVESSMMWMCQFEFDPSFPFLLNHTYFFDVQSRSICSRINFGIKVKQAQFRQIYQISPANRFGQSFRTFHKSKIKAFFKSQSALFRKYPKIAVGK